MTGPPLGPTTGPGTPHPAPLLTESCWAQSEREHREMEAGGKAGLPGFLVLLLRAQEAAQGSLGALTPQPGQEQSSWLDPHLDKAS